jgi:hypothetical protein
MNMAWFSREVLVLAARRQAELRLLVMQKGKRLWTANCFIRSLATLISAAGVVEPIVDVPKQTVIVETPCSFLGRSRASPPERCTATDNTNTVLTRHGALRKSMVAVWRTRSLAIRHLVSQRRTIPTITVARHGAKRFFWMARVRANTFAFFAIASRLGAFH